MLDILKLVVGAVADKDIVPVLTHVHFYDGRAQGQDGRLAIDMPVDAPFDGELTVPAEPLYRAIKTAEGQTERWEVKDGKLHLTAGRFKARMAVAQDPYPRLEPLQDATHSADVTAVDLLEALTHVRPFIGEDGSRPWACGVLLDGPAVYATNNVALVRRELSRAVTDRRLVLPVLAVDELLRLGKQGYLPQSLHITDYAATFYYGNGGWLRTNLLTQAWPDVGAMLPETVEGDDLDIADIAAAVEQVAPFSPDKKAPIVQFDERGVSTTEGNLEATMETGALPEGKYRSEILRPVLAAATAAQFSAWPSVVPFKGDRLIGIMAGCR